MKNSRKVEYLNVFSRFWLKLRDFRSTLKDGFLRKFILMSKLANNQTKREMF